MKKSLFCLIGLVLVVGLLGAHAAEPSTGAIHYFDEENMRHLTLVKADFGNTNLTVRFASSPGSASTWIGSGQRKDKEMLFALIVNEGEERGTFFIAEISESKVKITYKPGQKEPMDAGINGEYRRANEPKRVQLAKKEFQLAHDVLVENLKMATKSWDAKDKPALAMWKDQWLTMRQRWLDTAMKRPPAPAQDAKAKPVDAALEKSAENWDYLARATADGYYWLGEMTDPKTDLGWDGDYRDFGGGYASLRLSKDGKLRLSLSSQRIHEEEASVLDATALPAQISKAKNGDLTAEFAVTDAEVTDPTKKVKVKLTKIGHFLHVETQNAQRSAGLGWFDGIYRGAPVPQD